MDYEKKVLVLKQTAEGFSIQNKTITGILRVEAENGVAECFITLINVAYVENTEYYAFVVDSKKNVCVFELGKRPTHLNKVFDFYPNIVEGFSAGIIASRNYENTVIAFSRSQDCSMTIDKFYEIISKRLPKKPPESKREISPEQIYNDEAVATENYFDNTDTEQVNIDLDNKLEYIKRLDNASLHDENVLPFDNGKEEKEEIRAHDFGVQDEANAKCGDSVSSQEPYYKSVEGELTDIFEKFPPDNSLVQFFPQSKWAKINYSSEKYYIVGIIKENGKEKYICYGVPSNYSETPPKELDGFCSFIPLSVFNLKGKGFWMMFQDAITGKCVKLDEQK